MALTLAFAVACPYVGVQRAGHRRTKPAVSTAAALRNVVGKAVDISLETIVPLQRATSTPIPSFSVEKASRRYSRIGGFILKRDIQQTL